MRVMKIFVLFPMLLTLYTVSYCANATTNIEVFFNQPESESAKSEIANSDKGIDDALVEFFQGASSGDNLYICFYDSTTAKITAAIESAAAQVGNNHIFHIMDEENATAAAKDDIVGNPDIYNFPNSIDDGSKSGALMHNKYAVIINTTAGTGRVWTGSYNPTSNGALENNNNALKINSYDLAKIFADEFIYMYNSGNGRFSVNKTTTPNTAKSITVDGIKIDVYFSPYSLNNTATVIKNHIAVADYSVLINMFTFSVNEAILKAAVKDAYDRGLEVKCVLEATQSSAIQSYFRSVGIDAYLDANASELHHKFCVLDYGSNSPKVITGSYNWTEQARDTHDENFLVIHSSAVASLYWKEFNKNFALSGGVSTQDNYDKAVSELVVFPSPADSVSKVTIGYTVSSTVSEVTLKIYDLAGYKVWENMPVFYAGTYNEKQWDLTNSNSDSVSSGMYILKIEAETGDGTFNDFEKFVVIK